MYFEQDLFGPKRRLMISFSGGETSAYMTFWILENWSNLYEEIIVVFANTGEEDEKTLKFVKRCDEEFNFSTVWVEAVIHQNERKGSSHKIVNFQTATRQNSKDGPFEKFIQKYGIPNQSAPSCTRDLKLAPIQSLMKKLGWKIYDTAIGIRSDEIDRISTVKDVKRIVYPLVKENKKTKIQINDWWRGQSFRLELKHYQGNCVWCWKKTKRKHFTLLSENPRVLDFPEKMEKLYPRNGPEFLKDPDAKDRTFFRKRESAKDIREQYEEVKNSFTPYSDDADVYSSDLDTGGGCEESCELY